MEGQKSKIEGYSFEITNTAYKKIAFHASKFLADNVIGKRPLYRSHF